VAVRFSPLWVGVAPAVIAPQQMLEDLEGVSGCRRLRRARADVCQSGEFSGGAHDSLGTCCHRKRTDIRVVEGEQTTCALPRYRTKISADCSAKVARVREIVELR